MNIDPKTKQAVGKVVAAGMKVMYSPAMRSALEKGLSGQSPVSQRLAMQVAGLLKMLDDRAKMTIPKQAMAPAAMFLIQDLANFMESSMGIKISPEELSQAMQACIKLLVTEYSQIQQQGQSQAQQTEQQSQQPPPNQVATGLIGARQ